MKSSTPWAITERLVQIYITQDWESAHPLGQKPQQHMLYRGTEVCLSFSRAHNYCVRHQGSTPGSVRGFWEISIPDSICLCFVQGADTVSLSQAVPLLRGPQPSHQSQCIFYGNCSRPREEMEMFWNVPWHKNTDIETAQQNNPDSTKFKWGVPKSSEEKWGWCNCWKCSADWFELHFAYPYSYKAGECEQRRDFSASLNEETRFQGDT